jgi:heme O synthase-like polyprenyltransferase
MSLVNAILLIFCLLFAWGMYRFNRARNNDYNVVDILMGPNKRASLTNHILLAMALLSTWVVVDREIDGKDDVTTLLLGVLGIFVVGKTATAVTDILNRPDLPPKPKGK